MERLTYRNDTGKVRLCDRLHGIGICLEGDLEQVAQYEEKIPKLEAVINQYKTLASQYQREAAKYRTLYYNLLRRYRDITEE